MHGPSPFAERPQLDTAFLQTIVTRPNIEVGRFSYYHDRRGPERFETEQVLYHFEPLGDLLKIGAFVAIAENTRFIMNGANHAMTGFSTYPFNIFENGWEDGFDPDTIFGHLRGHTIVGPDVWIGNGATILPGVTIGAGAIIGAGAVVGSDIPPYAIAVGNPARILRTRFDEATVRTLLSIAWWDWPIDVLSANVNAIRGRDLEAMERISAEVSLADDDRAYQS